MYRTDRRIEFIQKIQNMRLKEIKKKEAAQFIYNTTPVEDRITVLIEVLIEVPFGTTVAEAAFEVEAVINDVDDKDFKLIYTEGILDYPVYPDDKDESVVTDELLAADYQLRN